MVDALEEQLDRLFLALGDRTRRQMLRMLTKETRTVSELGEPFGITKQAVSKHLKVLEDAGLIKKEKDGRIQHCTFNPVAMERIERIVNQYKKFWSHQFDALEKYLDETNKKEKEK